MPYTGRSSGYPDRNRKLAIPVDRFQNRHRPPRNAWQERQGKAWGLGIEPDIGLAALSSQIVCQPIAGYPGNTGRGLDSDQNPRAPGTDRRCKQQAGQQDARQRPP